MMAALPSLSYAQTSVTFTVSSNTDDADEESDGTMYINDGAVYLSGHCGFRFQNVTIPAGATIISATLEVLGQGTGTTSFSVDLTAQDADNPSTFTSSNGNISSRSLTSNQTLWSVGSTSFSDGQVITSPNFASSIQEVVDRSGWSSGNSMVVITTPNSGNKALYARDAGAAAAQKLHVTYTTAGAPNGKTVLLVTADTSLTTEETARQGQFESWGYTVETIADGDTESAFSTALEAADVVYVPQSADAASLAYKLRTTSVGVVHEGVTSWDDNVGWTTSTGQNTNTSSTMTVVDNSHPITEHFSTGTVSIFNSSTASYGSQVVATVASGASTLATNQGVNSGNPNVLVLETGSTLANTYNGNSTANGRRVRLPYGGSFAFAWSNVSSGGLTMVQKALAWAAADGLLLHWELDEGSGTTIADSTGNGNDAVFDEGTPVWSDGVRGGALEFDGSNDIDSASSVALPNTGSVSLWYYFPAVPTSKQQLLDGGSLWDVWADSDGRIYCGFGRNDGSSTPIQSPASTIQAGRWMHLVANYDVSTGGFELYINAELVDSGTTTMSSIPAGTIYGASSFGNANRMVGKLDDIRIYERMLTQKDVNELYGLIGHWRLDETSGTTAADSSENDNDGTLNNGTTPGADGPYPGAGAYAAAFDGVDDTITVPSDEAYDVTESVTVATWVRFNQDQEDHSSQHSLVGRFSWTNKRGFQLLSDAPNSNTLRFRVFNGTTYRDATWSNASMQGDRWYHVVGTYDRETIRLYVDGQQVASQAWTEAIEPEPNKTLTIGSKVAGRQHGVRLYNRALTGLEVAELHGLVAHWKLNESSGTVADDSSLAENDAALVGTQGWTAGQDGGGHKFDGSAGDNYFEAPATSSLEDIVLGSYTLMAYYRPDSVGSQQAIVTKDDGDFGIDYNPSGFFRVDHTLSDDSVIFINSSRSYPVGSFVHVAAVVDIDAGTVKIYIDGVENDSANYTPGIAGKVFNRAWRLGARHPSGLQADGVIDDVRFYNRAVSAEDIARHANLGLVARWTLSEASGTDAADSGDNGYDGTYTGGVALDQDEPHPGMPAPTFDGVDDEVTLPAIQASFTAGLTIAAWIRPDETLSAGQFNEIFELSNGSQVDQILLSYGGATGLQLYLTDTADGSTLRTIEDNDSFVAGQWVHCVAVVDPSGNATLYRNGQVTKSGFFTSLPTNVLRSTAMIGKSSFGDRFKGGIQDVRLYNYGLTQAEVNKLYGLVGHWDFEEGSGTTAAEKSGNASNADFNTGTPAWVAGVRGTALEFDGTNDARTAETFDPPERGAVSMWFRSDGPPTSRQRPWGLGGDYEMWQDTDGLVSMDVSVDGFQGGFITTDPLYAKGRWYHLVAQYDSADESYEIYIDGALHKSGVSTRDIKKQAANYLSFGTRTGSSQRFTGAIDDFRIYNRWLSIGEVAKQYGLVGWWRMEEGSGSTVSDSSGAGNHGAFVGAGGWSTNAKEASGSIELDGTNHVEIPSLILSEGSGTIAGWARLTDNDSYGSELISLGNHFGIRIDSTRSGQGSYGYTYNGSNWNDVKPNIYHEGAGWHHFVLVANDEDLTRKFYIDGVLQETITASGPLVMSGQDSTTLIGSKGSNYDFTGQIDDVRVYNRAIDPTEVRTLYFGQEVFGPRIVKWIEVANP